MIGETVYVNGTTAVENVLVSAMSGVGFNTTPLTQSDITKPVGPICDYTLYFPMSYVDDLTGQKITVRNNVCEVIGSPDHERPDQVFTNWLGQWDMTVYVRRTEAAYSESIVVKYQTYTRDYLGDRTAAKPETVYTGSAQVRLKEAGEKDANFATIAHETRIFVFPWQSGLVGKAPQSLFIEFNGKTYDVKSVNNVDEKGEFASIEAVYRND